MKLSVVILVWFSCSYYVVVNSNVTAETDKNKLALECVNNFSDFSGQEVLIVTFEKKTYTFQDTLNAISTNDKKQLKLELQQALILWNVDENKNDLQPTTLHTVYKPHNSTSFEINEEIFVSNATIRLLYAYEEINWEIFFILNDCKIDVNSKFTEKNTADNGSQQDELFLISSNVEAICAEQSDIWDQLNSIQQSETSENMITQLKAIRRLMTKTVIQGIKNEFKNILFHKYSVDFQECLKSFI